jgi:hypothetical protein
LINLVPHSDVLPGLERRAFIDIDLLLRPVYGHAKQGASCGHAKIAGRSLLRRGLSPLVTTISTDDGAPMVAGIRLRSGRAGSGKGAASMVREAINTARAAGATGEVLLRGDSAFGISPVVHACLKAGGKVFCGVGKHRTVDRAIGTIPEDAWTPVHYPGAVVDPDTDELISDAEVRRGAVHRVRRHKAPGHSAATDSDSCSTAESTGRLHNQHGSEAGYHAWLRGAQLPPNSSSVSAMHLGCPSWPGRSHSVSGTYSRGNGNPRPAIRAPGKAKRTIAC